MSDLYGSIKGTELAAKCRRRLWDIPRNHDAEIPMVWAPVSSTSGVTPTICEARPRSCSRLPRRLATASSTGGSP